MHSLFFKKRLDLDYRTLESKFLNYESFETSDLSFWHSTFGLTIFDHLMV